MAVTDKKLKVDGLRRFMVFTKPHPGDPAWLHPCIEIDDSTDPPTELIYDDLKVIEQVVLDMARAMQRAAGYNAGVQAVLKTFGLTPDDYYKKKRADRAAKKSEKSLDNSGNNPLESQNG